MNKYIDKTVKNKYHIQLTVAVEDDQKRIIKTYDHNSNESEYNKQRYEIGSLTKIFTASLISSYISEDKISLNDSLDIYFQKLNKSYFYPSIDKLLSHNSGYKARVPFTKKKHIEKCFMKY